MNGHVLTNTLADLIKKYDRRCDLVDHHQLFETPTTDLKLSKNVKNKSRTTR